MLAFALTLACSPAAHVVAPSPAGPTASAEETKFSLPTPSAPPSATPAPPHVFVIVMENASLGRALAAPGISAIAAKSTVAMNYHAVGRPSLPNYLALTSGTTWGITDDGYHALPEGGIGAQLTAADITWRAYMEGLTSAGCMRSPYPYALKHNPFAYYGAACPENVVSLDALDADLAGDTPSFVWITPGLCHDGHDCALSQAGPWLSALTGRIEASAAWKQNGILFIVWDEGDGGGSNIVPLIAHSPNAAPGESDAAYDHYSLLATIEDVFGLPRLGGAGTARPLTGLLSTRLP
jgi:hypothetical protein